MGFGINIRVLSGIGIEDPKVKEIAGDLINGIIYTTPAYNPNLDHPVVNRYKNSFREKYNKES